MKRYAEARVRRGAGDRELPEILSREQEVRTILAFLQAAQRNVGQQSSAANDDDTSDEFICPSGAEEAQETAPPHVHGAGNLHEATGVVTDLSCMNGLKIRIANCQSGPLTLQLMPGAQLRLRLALRPAGPFNPCTALKGQRVTVDI